MRPISKPKPKLSSPERVWYWRKAPIAATCRRNDSNTIHRTDRGRAGKFGRSITGEFIRSHQKRSSGTMVWTFWVRSGVHLENKLRRELMSSIRTILLFVLIACLAATLSFARGQGSTSNSKPEDQVTQLERDWLAADPGGDLASLWSCIFVEFMSSSFRVVAVITQ